ncbi:hypothetical protein E3227_03675 [Corynebacterium sanguinis]|nr:hypothetical protein E3227_03675 [Corynebacterium sanguinis]
MITMGSAVEVDGRSHTFRPVATVLGGEGGFDLRCQHRIGDKAFLASRGRRFPLVVGRPVDLDYLT